MVGWLMLTLGLLLVKTPICNAFILVSCLSPPLRVVKINFAASVISQKAVVGFIIWNHQARLIQASGKLLMHSPVPFAELIAAELGLSIAM